MSLFGNLRFTAASVSVAISFFALSGFIFLVTQYAQLIKSWGPLSTGVRLLPVASCVAIASILGAKLAVRIGTKLVVASGLLSMAGFYLWVTTAETTTSYLTITAQMMVLGTRMGLTSAPATEAIMGVVPKTNRVLLQFTGERLPRKLANTWATVDRGPIPAFSSRVKVRADSETNYPRNIELGEIRASVRDGRTIATRVQRPGAFPLETAKRRSPARWEIVRRSYNTGRVLKTVARDIPEYPTAQEERRKWAEDERLRRSDRWYYDVRG